MLAALILLPTPALACSCVALAPESVRAQASDIIEGRVLSVSRNGGINGRVTARISVNRWLKGGTPSTIAVTTRGNSAACGYAFKVGQRGEFLLRVTGKAWSTDLCLMRGAGR